MSSSSIPPPVGQDHCEGEDARDWSEDRIVDDDDDWIDAQCRDIFRGDIHEAGPEVS